MSEGLYLVFSRPPASVSAADYDRWYADHLRENIEVPGFRAGRRYELEHTVAGGDPDADFSRLAVYETTAGIGELRAALDRRREAGEIVLPDWFGEIGFSSWHCRPLEERVEAPGD
jgi:hypothetical protein